MGDKSIDFYTNQMLQGLPIENETEDLSREEEQSDDTIYPNADKESAYLRFFHAVPNAGPLDIYVQGRPFSKNLNYRQFTKYIAIPPGNYNVLVFSKGNLMTALIDTQVNLGEGEIYTAAINGVEPFPSLTLIRDMGPAKNLNTVYLKFGNFSPDAPAVDLRTTSDKVLFSGVEFGQVSEYMSLPKGTYDFIVTPQGINRRLLSVPNAVLQPGRLYSFYLIGFVNGTPGLQAVIPLDGGSYIPSK